MFTYPVGQVVNRLQTTIPVRDARLRDDALELLHQLWIYWLWHRGLTLFESLVWRPSHAKTVLSSWIIGVNLRGHSSSTQKGWSHFRFKKGGLLEAITTCCSSSTWWCVWSTSLCISSTPWIHGATSHTSSVPCPCIITQRFVILLLNYFSCLFNLLVCKVTSQQKLIEFSRIWKWVLESKNSKLCSLSYLLCSLF